MSDTFPNDVWRLICSEFAVSDVRTLAKLQRCCKRFKFIFAGLTKISLTSLKDLRGPNKIAVNIVSQLARLQSLSLAKCSNLNLSFLIAIGSSLTELDVSNNLKINRASLVLIGQACPRLQILNLNGCRKIDDLAFAYFCAPNLPFDPEVSEVSQLQLQLEPYTSLHTLGIRGCFLLADEAIGLLSKRFVGLTSLDMGGLPNTSNGSFTHLSRLTKLKNLNLRSARQLMKDMTDERFNSTMNVLQLENLNLIDSPSTSLTFNFSTSTSLRVLDLQNADVTDVQLTNICTACPALEELNIMSCTRVTDQGMVFVSHLPRLKRLEVKELPLVTSNTFVQVFQSLKLLQVVNVSRNPSISDDVLEQLGTHSGHSLVTLNLQQCPQVTDKGLTILSKNCTRLSIINLDEVRVSDEAILELIEARKQTLQHLNIGGSRARNTKLIMEAMDQFCPFIFKLVVPDIGANVASFKKNHPFSIVKAGSQ